MNHSQTTRRRLGNRGTGAIEFAFYAALATTLLVCGVDIVNYARARLRLDEVSNSLASLVTNYSQLHSSDFNTFFSVAQRAAGELDVSQSNGETVITGITNSNGTTLVMWRQHVGTLNAGVANDGSNLGTVGGAPTLPSGYTVPANTSVIAVEVFSAVHPWVLSKAYFGTGGPPILGSVAMFQPRSALLSQIN